MTHTLLYTRDLDTNEPTVIDIIDDKAKFYRQGIKPYTLRAWANRYLCRILHGREKLPAKPDETIGKNPGETDKHFIDRVAEGVLHIGFTQAIWPKATEPEKCLKTPVTLYNSVNLFPPTDVWYETEAEAKKDADGIDTVYLGPVAIYDTEVLSAIREEMKTYAE